MGPALLQCGVAVLPRVVSAAVAVLIAMAEVVAFPGDAEHQGDLAVVSPRGGVGGGAPGLQRRLTTCRGNQTCHQGICDAAKIQPDNLLAAGDASRQAVRRTSRSMVLTHAIDPGSVPRIRR